MNALTLRIINKNVVLRIQSVTEQPSQNSTSAKYRNNFSRTVKKYRNVIYCNVSYQNEKFIATNVFAIFRNFSKIC